MSRKYEKGDWKLVLVTVVFIVLIVAAQMGLLVLYRVTGWLWVYFLDLVYSSGLQVFLFLYLLFRMIFFVEGKSSSKGKDKQFQKRFLSGLLVVEIAIFIIVNFFPINKVSNRYSVVNLNGTKPTGHEYMLAVLWDVVAGDTVETTVSSDHISTGKIEYRVKGGRGSSHRGTSHNISYQDDAVSFSVHQPWVASLNYVQKAKKMKNTFVIEYYVHSGVIKSIDYCGINDEKAFADSERKILEEYSAREAERLEKERLEQERQAAQKKEETRIWAVKFHTLSEGIGKPMEELIAEIEAQNSVMDCEVVYISTKHFDEGTLAFYANIENVVYVVKDGDAEDMLVIPHLDKSMDLDTIKRTLDEAGIRYTYDDIGTTNGTTNGTKRLNTYHCPPGTYIPKDYVYWFSVK